MSILTNLKARSITPDSKPLSHGGVAGLTLIPSKTKSGRGKWVLRYTSPVTKKRCNKGLGTFPEVSIAEAGKRATEMRALIEQDIDPIQSEKRDNLHRNSIPTFKDAAIQHHEELQPSWRNAKHTKQWLVTLEQYAFPFIGSHTLDKVTPSDIANVLRPFWLKIPETASRVKQRMHSVFAWGWAHGYCQSNPVDVVIHLLPKQPELSVRRKHMRSMPWKDVPAFVKRHLRGSEHKDISRLMLEFLILTAARSGEVRGMQWSEINWNEKVWTIPVERMKAHKQHRVPLVQEALDILHKVSGLHEDLVFPSPLKQAVLSDMALSQLIRGIFEKHYPNLEVPTVHGFRSSSRDWCSENSFDRDLAERALAHTIKNQVEAAYHRTDLLEKRRPMMESWSNYISGGQRNESQGFKITDGDHALAELLREGSSRKSNTR